MGRPDEIRAQLRAHGDPEKGAQQQRYMKSKMPFHGVPMHQVRHLTRQVAKGEPYETVAELRADAEELWRSATHREERYAAIELTGLRVARADAELLPFYIEVVRTGQWWDYVDAVAHRIGDLLIADREPMSVMLHEWAVNPDLWLRRVSIIAQVGHKKKTDVELLAAVIDDNVGERDFFIRKAIGWALREYGKTNPHWVREFVASRADLLSPLSRKEALRRLDTVASAAALQTGT